MKLKFNVAGTQYTNARFLDLQEGQVLTLEAEPSNKHDKFAIKVITIDGMHIGYVPKVITESVHRLLRLSPKITLVSKCSDSYLVSIHVLMEV